MEEPIMAPLALSQSSEIPETYGRAVCVQRIRNSLHLGATHEANFGFKSCTSKSMFLVWFSNLKFLQRVCHPWDRNFKFTTLGDFLTTLTRMLGARVEGEFDSNTTRLAYHEMDLRPLARQLRSEFHNNSRPVGNAFEQGAQSCSIGDCEG